MVCARPTLNDIPQCRSFAVSEGFLDRSCYSDVFARLKLPSLVLSHCLSTCELDTQKSCIFSTLLTTISRYLSWRIQICRSLPRMRGLCILMVPVDHRWRILSIAIVCRPCQIITHFHSQSSGTAILCLIL